MTVAAVNARALAAPEWLARESSHRQRALELTGAHRERRSRGENHPIEDFLFDYYAIRAGRLDRWHPGVGVTLLGDDELLAVRAGWRWHVRTPEGGVRLDASAFVTDRGPALRRLLTILRATAARAPHLGCLGLHEWAMVYRQPAAERRHDLPLRLGPDGTDAVVEAHPVRCTHFDAFRFFTPEARPVNRLQPTRETQPELEQPGCLHANMDLMHAAITLGPACPGELLLDCVELARDIRVLDMRASPYDVTSLGHSPVAIETTEGRAEYVAAQRAFAERSAPLRERLVAVGEELGL
ncbi:3-methyladenine DNA glycosylase [Georgenia phoenicis]|uniref:3-methyladenine DNA glycosylase n=1 Tax=unclassified Georgenia TaxID=2626815 RepID=UPI0039B0FFB0